MTITTKIKYLVWIRGIAHYSRKIPQDLRFFHSPDGKLIRIVKSLGTRDPREAEKRRDKFHMKVETLWDAARWDGPDPQLLEEFSRYSRLASVLGFDYRPHPSVVEESTPELHRRLQYLDGDSDLGTHAGRMRADAVLGLIPEPEQEETLLLSKAFEDYFFYSADVMDAKSKQQLRVWTNGKKKAMSNLIECLGDIDFYTFKRSHALEYKDWWWKRIKERDLKNDTANKDFEHLHQIFQKIIDTLRLDIQNEFRGIRMKQGERRSRVSLTREEALTALFDGNPLRKMNAEARAVVYICAELGARPIEIINRAPADIILDAPIPHVKIRQNIYGSLKTRDSKRDIPLIGEALRMFEQFPEGFPKYAGNAASCVTAINKFLRENRVLPQGATLYSFRHAFQDRLIDLEAPPRLQKELMGHSLGKVKYGRGHSLEKKLDWLSRIALSP